MKRFEVMRTDNDDDDDVGNAMILVNVRISAMPGQLEAHEAIVCVSNRWLFDWVYAINNGRGHSV